jgi:hypothetical protein
MHPNIMRFLAITLDPPMIIMQYYSHGTLFQLLQVSADRAGLLARGWGAKAVVAEGSGFRV